MLLIYCKNTHGHIDNNIKYLSCMRVKSIEDTIRHVRPLGLTCLSFINIPNPGSGVIRAWKPDIQKRTRKLGYDDRFVSSYIVIEYYIKIKRCSEFVNEPFSDKDI